MSHGRNGPREQVTEAKEGPLELRRERKGKCGIGSGLLKKEPHWVLHLEGYLSGGLRRGSQCIFISFPDVSFWGHGL